MLNENDENNELLMDFVDFDPSLVPIPEGFNVDDEVLVIGKSLHRINKLLILCYIDKLICFLMLSSVYSI